MVLYFFMVIKVHIKIAVKKKAGKEKDKICKEEVEPAKPLLPVTKSITRGAKIKVKIVPKIDSASITPEALKS